MGAGLLFEIDDNRLLFTGPAETVARYQSAIKAWKPEIIRIVKGDVCGDVGACDRCGRDLLGLPVVDGFTNRVCQHCGKWHRCVETIAQRAGDDLLKPAKTNQSTFELV